jgi:Cu+-exporting ATPase
VASCFVPCVISIGIGTFVVWHDFGLAPAFIYSPVSAAAVLITACPCAVGLGSLSL